MGFELIIPAIAALAGGAATYFGGQNANNANSANAIAQMNFQQAQSVEQEQFTREMWQRQSDFNREGAETAFNRQRELMDWTNQTNLANRDFQASFVNQSIDRQEAFQREMAQQAQDFSLQSSATAWQRATADMKAAGINPMLAYQRGGASSPIGVSGSGASGTVAAPPGATGSASAPTTGGGSRSAQSGAMATMQNILGPAVQSALQSARIFGEVQNLNAGAENTKAQTALIGEQQHQVRAGTSLAIANEANERDRNALIREQARNEILRGPQIRAQTGQSAASAQATAQDAEYMRRYGRQGTDPGSIVSQIEAAAGGPGSISRGASAARRAGEGVLRDPPSIPRPEPQSPENARRNQDTSDQINHAFRRLMELIRR